MKKIIYSLVIMIAAGSLFTSCVTNTEPQGIKDLRESKANYLDALSKLREADAEKVKAEATLVQAQAATEQARAAWVQAKAKAEEINNQFVSDTNAIHIAKAKAEAEVALKEAEADLVKQEKALAWAEESLRQALVAIALEANKLTWAEQTAISAYTRAYNKVLAKQADVKRAEAALYDATYNDYGENSVEAEKARWQDTVAIYTALAAQNQAYYDNVAEVAEDEIGKYEVWAAEYEKLRDSITGYDYLAADLAKEQGVYGVENREAFESFYASIKKQQDAVTDAIAKATFSFNEDYDLPADALEVVNEFKRNIVNILPSGIVTSPSANKMKVKGSSSNVKTAIYGSEAKPDSSLAGIIDALKRDSVVTDQLVKDTAGLAAAVAKIDSTYKAVKDTLEDGIAEWKGIKDALTKAAAAAGKPAAARAKYTQDTAALFKSISDFIEIWNDIAGASGNVLDTRTIRGQKYNDSLDIFNALKSIMVNRTKVFNEDAKFGFYYLNRSGQVKKDTVLFSEIDFEFLQDKTFDVESDGQKRNKGFQNLLNGAFGTTGLFDAYVDITTTPGKIEIKPITVQNIKGTGSPAAGSVLFQNLFFGKWWVSDKDNVFGEIYKKGGNTTKYAGEYPAYKTAYKDSSDAAKAVNKAKDKYYNDFYCKFWGLDSAVVYNSTAHKLNNSADSLKINYTEKTYTDPYLIPVFEFQAGAFTAANGNTPARFDTTKINLKSTLELETVEGFVGKNIKNSDGKYTLYAEKLYAEKFAKVAKTWKENTKALAELEAVVEKVKADYTAKTNSVAAAQAAADSIVTAVLGEDIVKKALKDSGKKHATDLWTDATLRGNYFVNYTSGSRNIDAFCKNGKFTFGGQQLAAAEAYISDYPAKTKEWATKTTAMNVAKTNCNDLATIIKDYVDAIQAIDVQDPEKQYTPGTDPKDQAEKVYDYYVNMLEDIQDLIDDNKEKVALAEGALAKIEAGYDWSQVAIEHAADMLEIAQKELEQAEVELAAAEATYKQVLANHGITE